MHNAHAASRFHRKSQSAFTLRWRIPLGTRFVFELTPRRVHDPYHQRPLALAIEVIQHSIIAPKLVISGTFQCLLLIPVVIRFRFRCLWVRWVYHFTGLILHLNANFILFFHYFASELMLLLSL